MPYAIRSAGGGKVKVVNTETGNVHSKATTRANAEAQVRLLHGVEHGMRPRTTKEVIGTMPSARMAMHKKPAARKTHKDKGRTKGAK